MDDVDDFDGEGDGDFPADSAPVVSSATAGAVSVPGRSATHANANSNALDSSDGDLVLAPSGSLESSITFSETGSPPIALSMSVTAAGDAAAGHERSPQQRPMQQQQQQSMSAEFEYTSASLSSLPDSAGYASFAHAEATSVLDSPHAHASYDSVPSIVRNISSGSSSSHQQQPRPPAQLRTRELRLKCRSLLKTVQVLSRAR